MSGTGESYINCPKWIKWLVRKGKRLIPFAVYLVLFVLFVLLILLGVFSFMALYGFDFKFCITQNQPDYLSVCVSSFAGASVVLWSAVQFSISNARKAAECHSKAIDIVRAFNEIGGVDICLFYEHVLSLALKKYYGKPSKSRKKKAFMNLVLLEICRFSGTASLLLSDAFMEVLRRCASGNSPDRQGDIKYLLTAVNMNLIGILNCYKAAEGIISSYGMDQYEVAVAYFSMKNVLEVIDDAFAIVCN